MRTAVVGLVMAVGLCSGCATMTHESKLGSVPKDAATFNGHHYQVIKDKLTWHEAKLRCEKLGGHLVCIESTDENEFVWKLLGRRDGSDAACCWIGATDEIKEGNWMWVTGHGLSVSSRQLIHDESGGEGENYLNMRLSSGKWEDFSARPEAVGDQWLVCEWDY